MHKLSEANLILDYLDGVSDYEMSPGEMALIYSVMPELLLDMQCGAVDLYI